MKGHFFPKFFTAIKFEILTLLTLTLKEKNNIQDKPDKEKVREDDRTQKLLVAKFSCL